MHTKLNNISVRGQGDSKRYWMYCGVWYKPWTWLKWNEVYVINDFKLIDFSFVTNPIDPNCKINLNEGKQL